MISQIGLIDYGMGNLHSVEQAFKRLDTSLKPIRKPKDLKGCDALVLPGVGSFDPAMEHLKRSELIPDLKAWVKKDNPLLGICLGLQLLFESSDEGSSAGLGILKGHVHHLPTDQGERVPHMGWAPLNQKKICPLLDEKDLNNWMYFVHSYSAIPTETSDLAATTNFGTEKITAIVWKGRIGACQFHPEKSSKAGSRMLSRWLDWLKNGSKPIL